MAVIRNSLDFGSGVLQNPPGRCEIEGSGIGRRGHVQRRPIVPGREPIADRMSFETVG